MKKQAQMYKSKSKTKVTFREVAGQLEREREKKNGEKGIFPLQEREIS